MTTYARIVSGQAVDVTQLDPIEAFHADVAAEFVVVPDGTADGDRFDGTTWSKPAPPTAPVAQRPKLTPMTFYLAFSPAERIKIKASTDPVVMEFWDTYQRAERTETMVDPNLISVQEGLAYLAQPAPGPAILASKDRIDQILAGIPQ
jgi:hypothetical protein